MGLKTGGGIKGGPRGGADQQNYYCDGGRNLLRIFAVQGRFHKRRSRNFRGNGMGVFEIWGTLDIDAV